MNNRDLVDIPTNIFSDIHFYMHTGDVRLIDDTVDAHQNINIYTAMLNLISNFADREDNTDLNALLKQNIDVFLKRKASRSLSPYFENDLSKLIKLPANEIIQQYKQYVDFLRKNAYFLDICRQKHVIKSKESSDDNSLTIQTHSSQTDLLNPHEMVQLVIDVATYNKILFINDPDKKRSIFIYDKILNKHGFFFLCLVNTPMGIAHVIGEVDKNLLLHVYPDSNQNDDNQAKPDSLILIPLDQAKEFKKIEAPNYTGIVQTEIFQTILTSLEKDIIKNTQKFALFNLLETKDSMFVQTNNLIFTNTTNIFLGLHAWLIKNCEKAWNFQKNLSIFTAMLDFIAKNADLALNLKELLLNNIRTHTRFLFLKDEFYSLLTSIGSYSEEKIKDEYTKYKILMDQAEKFLTLGSEKGKANVESLNNLALITNSGSIIEVDISAKALNQFGLGFSESLTTEKGSEIALGVCNNELLTHCMPGNMLHSSSIVLDTLKNVVTTSKSTNDPMPHLLALATSIVQNNLPEPKKVLTFSAQSTSSVFSRFFDRKTELQNVNHSRVNASNNNDSPKQGM